MELLLQQLQNPLALKPAGIRFRVGLQAELRHLQFLLKDFLLLLFVVQVKNSLPSPVPESETIGMIEENRFGLFEETGRIERRVEEFVTGREILTEFLSSFSFSCCALLGRGADLHLPVNRHLEGERLLFSNDVSFFLFWTSFYSIRKTSSSSSLRKTFDYNRRPRRPPLRRVLSEGIGVTSSRRQKRCSRAGERETEERTDAPDLDAGTSESSKGRLSPGPWRFRFVSPGGSETHVKSTDTQRATTLGDILCS